MAILPFCAQSHPACNAGQTIGFKTMTMFGLSYLSAQLVLGIDYASQY